MSLTKEREKEIRSEVKGSIEEAIDFYGVKEMLAEIDALRAELEAHVKLNEPSKVTKYMAEAICLEKERDALRAALEKMIEAGRDAYDNGYPEMERAVVEARKALGKD